MIRTSALVTLVLALAAGIAGAQGYPSRPVRLVVPYPPGGTTDILARLLAERVGPSLGQQMIVENRAGATGMIGAESVARSAPDGHTLLMGVNGPLSIMPAIREQMPYDSLKDFAPVILAARAPKLFVVHPSIPAATPRDLAQHLKAAPARVSFASAGFGSTGHLVLEQFKVQAGVEMTHVPYKGGGPAIADLVAGHVQVAAEVMPQLLPLVTAGKIRAIAITSSARSSVLPALPTVAESGFPGFESYTWFGIVTPSGTPTAAIERLHAEFEKVLLTTDLQKRLQELGAEYAKNTSAEFGQFMRSEFEKWRRVVKAAGVKE